MSKEREIRAMLEIYDKRTDEKTVMNYMKVCDQYSESLVSSVIKSLIGDHPTIFNPRTLMFTLKEESGRRRKDATCDNCGGLGYTVLTDIFDDYELRYWSKGQVTRCYRFCNLQPGHPPLTPGIEREISAYAHIFARMVGARAVLGTNKDEEPKTLKSWGQYIWTKENFRLMCKLVKEERVSSMDLVRVKLAIREVDVGLCATELIEAAGEALRIARGLPGQELFTVIT